MPRNPKNVSDAETEKGLAEEFFYIDDDGSMQDANLHNKIIRDVDYPIDESIMGPIREKNRKAYHQSKADKKAANKK